jgi:hypothetical protein
MRNYTNSIVILLVVIWVSAAAYGLISARHARRTSLTQPSEG